MESAQIQELARAVADHAILDTWPYWITLLALIFIAVVVANYVASYAAKRGEVKAARADRQHILDGIQEATRAAEDVRSAIALGEWTERARRELRRHKLEELLLLAYRARDWLQEERTRFICDDTALPRYSSPQPTMLALGRLYFPELDEPLRSYDSACNEYRELLMTVEGDAITAKMKHQGDPVRRANAKNAVWENSHHKLIASDQAIWQRLQMLDDAAGELMARIIAPTSGDRRE